MIRLRFGHDQAVVLQQEQSLIRVAAMIFGGGKESNKGKVTQIQSRDGAVAAMVDMFGSGAVKH